MLKHQLGNSFVIILHQVPIGTNNPLLPLQIRAFHHTHHQQAPPLLINHIQQMFLINNRHNNILSQKQVMSLQSIIARPNDSSQTIVVEEDAVALALVVL